MRVVVVSLALVTLLSASGCHVSSHSKNGKDDVSINTPLGGFSVQTDPGTVLQQVGLPPYPGAVPVNENRDKNSADVNLSFGNFHMRVQAAGFQSQDDPAKLEAFYRKALAQYSDVIACHDEKPVGEPHSTGMGLTCKDDRHVHADMDPSREAKRHEVTLKAGSPSRQHIVGLEPFNNGTRFDLVAIDMPNTNHD